jgi:AraC-like DNA-binding protein
MAVVVSRETGTAGRVRARSSPTVLTWVLPHLIAYVAGRGHDVTPITRIPGLQGRNLDDPDTRVLESAAVAAWSLAEEITGDALLGLHMAEAIPAGALDLLEYAFRASATVESALGQVARYGRVVSDRAAVQLIHHGDGIAVTFPGTADRQRAEFALAFLIKLGREATAVPLVPVEVRFCHAPAEDLFEHRAFFRAPLRFGEPANQFVVARSDVSRPLRSADSALAGVVRRRLEKMLAQIRADDSSASRIRRLLLDAITKGPTSAGQVAREIGLSERTLHRRLKAEGTSFRRILDSVRGELAAVFLREPHLGTAEVAYLLGYADAAAFHRAFRRLTGQTPLMFRRAQWTAPPSDLR